MAIRCQPCQAVLGAEVEGVDLRQVPDAATIDALNHSTGDSYTHAAALEVASAAKFSTAAVISDS